MLKIKREKVLVKPKDIKPSSPKLEVIGTLNPAAVRLPNGNICLYVRVIEKLKKNSDKNFLYSPKLVGEKKYKLAYDKYDKKKAEGSSDLDFWFEDGTKRLSFISHFRRVVLDPTGFHVISVDEKPSFHGYWWDGDFGVEDPRISKIGDLFVMTYVALSKDGNISTNLAISNDCESWYRRGTIFTHQNKDVVIFPERINHKYVSFIRPEGNFRFSQPHIWISYSENLDYWGDSKSFPLTRKKKAWDSGRVGAGPPPIKTKKGWLFIYHGVLEKVVKGKTRAIYAAGAVLLNLSYPNKILMKSPEPILLPNSRCEKGTFENKDVVFPTGMVLDKNKRDVLIFSGAGDTYTTVKKISIEKILKQMKKH
jgi:predicted GH43/DUF377 family glycosyl hydrolase